MIQGAFPDYDFSPVSYLITVHTGDRLGAASDSKVCTLPKGFTARTVVIRGNDGNACQAKLRTNA